MEQELLDQMRSDEMRSEQEKIELEIQRQEQERQEEERLRLQQLEILAQIRKEEEERLQKEIKECPEEVKQPAPQEQPERAAIVHMKPELPVKQKPVLIKFVSNAVKPKELLPRN